MKPARIVVLGAAACFVILGVRWAVRPHTAPEPVQVRVLPDDAEPSTAAAGGDLPRPVRRGDRVPDITLLDQDGREFRLGELRGQVLVVGFLYTHCEVASLCPLTTTLLGQTHRLVRERQIEGVRFLLVSFDTERDTPEHLREYASRRALDAPNFTFATGKSGEVRRLSLALNTFYREREEGVFDHNTVVSVIDRENVLREGFVGNAWTPDQLAAAIEEAAAHPFQDPVVLHRTE